MLGKNRTFNNIKIHTQYSICEGAIKIDDLAEYCKNNKIKSLGLADSYNLCGALEFSEKLSKVGTQPIIGTQINLKGYNFLGKITLYAKSENGYKNLTRLSSLSYLNSKETEEPACELKDLIANNNDLILLTGNYRDFFGKLFHANKTKSIREILNLLKKNFSNRIYIEIQRHYESSETNFENYLLEISKSLNIPLIASQEVLYIDKEMYEAHDALKCIGEKSFIEDDNRLKLSNQHYLKNHNDLVKLYSDIPEALENNFNFHLRFNFKPKKSKPILPSITNLNSNTPEVELTKQAESGLEKRIKNLIIKKNSKDENEIRSTYLQRLKHEINIINSMNYASYFLIVSDYIKWAKSKSIPVGPGRGSGAGSLVAYCLDITDLNPIKYDLIFERFLNPDRISMPDFDIDFCEEKRDRVFEYLKTKYKDGVAHIITFGKLKARMALRDVGRVLGLSYGHVDRLCKMVPFDPSRPLTLQESIDREPRFQEEIKKNRKVQKLLELSLKLEGLNRNMATHAAGVVIAGDKLSEQFPLYVDHSSDLILPSTQYDMYSSENAGLVKFDLLGLKTLTVIDKTIKRLKAKNINLDISEINQNDQQVFSLLSTGETTGLFQLESAGMREAIKQMRPNKFDDIIALVALYRPGPMSNIPIYNECKQGKREPDYLHPKLEEILKPTYGVIIYQEQVMQIAQVLSGFTAGEADILRRAMGKKKRAELEKQKQRFVDGAFKNGISKDVSAGIFLKIEPFAEYGFNKSHAAAYAVIAYQTAYLKTHFPHEFFVASMSMELSNQKKLSEFHEELKRLKIPVIRPDINKSNSNFFSDGKNFYYALGAIKNVGLEAITNVVNERNKNGIFKNLSDFINRINPKDINKLQLEGLVQAGCFDELNCNRQSLFNSIPNLILKSKNIHENKLLNQNDLFGEQENININFLENIDDWNTDSKLTKEFETLGFYISDHPLNQYKSIYKQYNIVNYDEFENNSDILSSNIACTVLKVQEKKTQKGTSYGIVKFSDLSNVFELFIFSEAFELNRNNLYEGNSLMITLIKNFVDDNKTQKRINVKKMMSLKELTNKQIKNITFKFNNIEDFHKIKKLSSINGETEINILFDKDNKIHKFMLKDKRMVNNHQLNTLNLDENVVIE